MDVSNLLDRLATQPQQGMDRQGVSKTSEKRQNLQDEDSVTFEKEFDKRSSTDRAAEKSQDVNTASNEADSSSIKANDEANVSSSDNQASDINSKELQDADIEEGLQAMISGQSEVKVGDQSLELPELSEEERLELESLLLAWQSGKAEGASLKDLSQKLSESSKEKLEAFIQKLTQSRAESTEALTPKPVENKQLLEQMQKMRDVQAKAQATMMKMDDFINLVKIAPKAEPHANAALENTNPKGLAEKNPQLVEQQKTAGSLKDLTSTLFVQKSLNGQMETNLLQAQRQQIMVKSPDMQTPLASSVRTNLFEDMQGQISQFAAKQEGGEISLKLRPGNLGEVKIQIEVSKDVVRLQMQTEKPVAEQILRSQVNDLKQQLAGAGLKLDDIQVSQSPKNLMSQNDQNQDGRQSSQKDSEHEGQKQNPREDNQQQPKRSFDEFPLEQSVA